LESARNAKSAVYLAREAPGISVAMYSAVHVESVRVFCFLDNQVPGYDATSQGEAVASDRLLSLRTRVIGIVGVAVTNQ
jgi:hypothetical protein